MLQIFRKNFTMACLFLGLSSLFVLALGRIHLRTQTTLTGYRLGKLKEKEADLLETRSRLRMQVAASSTHSNLWQQAQKAP